MRVGILTVQVPFVRGGAEAHARSLRDALREAGHQAEIITLPFAWYPPELLAEQMLACKLVDVEESCGVPIDRVIGLKFPAYLVDHPDKVLWILHQHRSAYDLWGKLHGDLHAHPEGRDAANLIRSADQAAIPAARRVFANSRNVADRLRRYCGIDSTPLHHPPPHADRYRVLRQDAFMLMPGRINALKRQELVIAALEQTRHDVRLVVIGAADEKAYAERVGRRSASLPPGRIQWLGQVPEEEKLRLFGSCLAVVAPPVDEDYGYVSLEAMLSSKPVITCSDSGGPLEFVLHGQTGLVCEPDAPSLAAAMDKLWGDQAEAARLGRAARAHYDALALSWNHVVETLLA